MSISNGASFRFSREQLVLAMLLTSAFLSRLSVRVAFGEDYFWSNSYSLYYDVAKNIASGKGFLFGSAHAWLTPAYPLFLALTTLAGKSYFLIIVPQALMGAGTALCAFLIGRHIFQASVGILACGITAFYPYYVMHDTALHEGAEPVLRRSRAVGSSEAYCLFRTNPANPSLHFKKAVT